MYKTDTQKLINTARQRNIGDIPYLQSLKRPDDIALIYENHVDSFFELNRHIDRAANALVRAGVEKGDKVCLLSHNNRSFVIFRFAIIRAGAIVNPINFMLNANDIAYIIDHVGANAIISEDALCRVADDAIAKADRDMKFKAYIPFEGASVTDDWINSDDWVNYDDDTPVTNQTSEDETVQIMYTSGTESRPKGVLLSSRALISQYVTCIVDGCMEARDVELHTLPLYHCAQLDCFLTVDFYLGGKSILMKGAEPAAMLEAIERYEITKLFCPPTVWIGLLRHPDFDNRDLSSLEKGYYGASIMPTAIIQELTERLPNLKLWNFYGQTELAPVATVLQPEDQLTKLGSAGKPGININTRIVNHDDIEVSRGTVGEIVHQSPQATLGYLNDDKKTAEAFRNGWFHSGDLGYMDEEGFIYVVDRKKDMIKSGGENVASREVEEALFKHPDIAEVAVFGLPHEKWIEAVSAAIVLNDGATTSVEDIHGYCKTSLSGFKRPLNIFLTDVLPKNASGKILKRQLRDQYKDYL